jgi:hypothetical protein
MFVMVLLHSLALSVSSCQAVQLHCNAFAFVGNREQCYGLIGNMMMMMMWVTVNNAVILKESRFLRTAALWSVT